MITCVAVLKNREKERVENFLNSLKSQTVPCKIIIVDYGSNDTSWYDETFKDVHLIKVTRNTEGFNKARALNIGFKAADTKYVLSTDIDNVFASNFIEEVTKAIQTPKTLVLCRRWDTNEKGEKKRLHGKGAFGVCFAIEKEWMMKVHGYDEFYTFWGKEDDDIFYRATSDGYNPVWIEDKTEIIHQWHPIASRHTLVQNEIYFRANLGKSLIRNPNGWGEL